jgi:hypothetical protein
MIGLALWAIAVAIGAALWLVGFALFTAVAGSVLGAITLTLAALGIPLDVALAVTVFCIAALFLFLTRGE